MPGRTEADDTKNTGNDSLCINTDQAMIQTNQIINQETEQTHRPDRPHQITEQTKRSHHILDYRPDPLTRSQTEPVRAQLRIRTRTQTNPQTTPHTGRPGHRPDERPDKQGRRDIQYHDPCRGQCDRSQTHNTSSELCWKCHRRTVKQRRCDGYVCRDVMSTSNATGK